MKKLDKDILKLLEKSLSDYKFDGTEKQEPEYVLNVQDIAHILQINVNDVVRTAHLLESRKWVKVESHVPGHMLS